MHILNYDYVSYKNKISWVLKKKYCEKTAFARTIPNFLITGSSYCGKTLFYNYLVQHPHIFKNLREETGYFVSNFERGSNWYRSNFPLKITEKIFLKRNRFKPKIGETVNLSGTEVPERIVNTLKNPKIVTILRNPVDRAYVRYLAMVRRGLEKLTFEEAIENETKFFVDNEKKIIQDGVWPPLNSKLRLYRLSGIYIDYIIRWNQFIPMKKMFTVSSESLFQNPIETINESLKFLKLKPMEQIKNISRNYEKDANPMKEKTREELVEYFKPHNLRLFKFIGKEFCWER